MKTLMMSERRVTGTTPILRRGYRTGRPVVTAARRRRVRGNDGAAAKAHPEIRPAIDLSTLSILV